MLRCGVCAQPFKRVPTSMQGMIFQVGRLLCHAEPCSLDARYRLGEGR